MLERNGFLTIFYSRIIPGVAWGTVNYAAGCRGCRLRDLLLATVVGGTPKVFAYVALGGNLEDLDSAGGQGGDRRDGGAGARWAW